MTENSRESSVNPAVLGGIGILSVFAVIAGSIFQNYSEYRHLKRDFETARTLQGEVVSNDLMDHWSGRDEVSLRIRIADGSETTFNYWPENTIGRMHSDCKKDKK
jgi:hypothetical protein|tara:strand:+ start:5799 stop:6113 length:315 start_codon:yes stop_codon:yes gene_type:complete